MFTMMNNARLNVGLQGVSIAERATQQAVAYACERVQGSREGRPARIIEYPDVRRMLLRMKALTQAARALAYYCAGQTDRAQPRRRGGAGARRPADAAGQGLWHRRRRRGGQPRRPGPWRHGLYRGDRRRPALSRRPHLADLRRHQRHPGRRSGRAQARHGRRRGAAARCSPTSAPRRPAKPALHGAGRCLRDGRGSGCSAPEPDDRLAASYPVPDDAVGRGLRLADGAPGRGARRL